MKEMLKPEKLINVSTKNEVYDTLHGRSMTEGPCTRHVCNGAVMVPKKASGQPRSKDEVLKLAKEFIDEYYQSIKRFPSEQHRARWEQVKKEIEDSGTYELTQTELVYGAKLAWRNAPRCIGRIQWSKLQVFDARYVTTASGMFEALLKHIKYGTNKGNLRSAITVFPQRTDGTHDFRVWNAQILGYAGYRNNDGTVTGDPLNVEFTEVCQKLGWKGKGGRFDLLPLVLSADGQDPEWFDIPLELVLEVKIIHPGFDWFQDMDLRWYCFPAVSSLLFDCGGLEFPAAPFNGWYMVSEIGTRDLCDPFRYNILEDVGKRMGLDTSSNINLWKDKALVEVNFAVLYSFQKQNVTIVDHHTAAESFMKHFENEQKIRGGCPADWVWIVPPISGSITPVFHQEMAMYFLKPSYEYQEPAWRIHVWKKNRDASRITSRKTKRKFRFKEIARAVKFTSKLFGKALSKRIKATILYATETGKSENYAKKLGEIFGHTFNAQVHCMTDYDIIDIEHEALVLVVTSTFGNGDPPENGESFAKNLYSMKSSGTSADQESSVTASSSSNRAYYSAQRSSLHRSMSMMRMNSMTEATTPLTPIEKLSSLPFSTTHSGVMSEDNMGPLSNVRFAVFALGSSAYPNFCAFGKYIDSLLADLGGERLVGITCGDELAGQEQQFKKWAADVFKVGCETFCLEDEATMLEATAALKTESYASADKLKLVKVTKEMALPQGLSRAHVKNIKSCKVISSRNLHGAKASRLTQLVVFENDGPKSFTYQPGDHVAILPANQANLVDKLLNQLAEVENADEPIQLRVLNEIHTPNGLVTSWDPHERLPESSLRTLFTRYLDITTPPTSNFLYLLAEHAQDNEQKIKLEHLATDPHEYEEWKHMKYPNLPEVLEEFPSVKIGPALLLSQLPQLQPRFYSISSAPTVHKGEVHLTVAVVVYQTQAGKGPIHYGVCSNYLKNLQPGQTLECFVRSATNFHLPKDPLCPVIMVGPGTGIAPFRSFWNSRFHLVTQGKVTDVGDMYLFFGCRTRALDLYPEEKEEMVKLGVMKKTYVALSREPTIPKTYVQDTLVKVGAEVYQKIVTEAGHFYVCGDCTMAECVYQRLKTIIQECGKMSEQEVENYMLQMRDENRYHEDIFGITLRTEEIHRQTRESARNKLNFQTQKSASLTID